MAHYEATLILPATSLPSQAEVEEQVAAILAPYFEWLEVPEYSRICWCVDCSNWETNEIANYVRPDIHGRRPRYPGSHAGDEALLAWQEQSKDWSEKWAHTMVDVLEANPQLKSLWKESHPVKYAWLFTDRATKHKCAMCNGTGTITATDNPQNRWDKYMILWKSFPGWGAKFPKFQASQEDLEASVFKVAEAQWPCPDDYALYLPDHQCFVASYDWFWKRLDYTENEWGPFVQETVQAYQRNFAVRVHFHC